MKQKDGSGQGKGSPSYTAAQKLAMKKAGKKRTDYSGSSGFGDSATAHIKDSFPYGISRADIASLDDPNQNRADKRFKEAMAAGSKRNVSQTAKGYTPWQGGMTNPDGSVAQIGGSDKATYEADNKGISATRGRKIKQDMKYRMEDGAGPIEAGRAAIREVNRYGNDSVVTPAKIGRKGEAAAYKEALEATWDHSRPASKAEKAEKNRLKKAKQRGDLGRGAGGSGATLNYGQ